MDTKLYSITPTKDSPFEGDLLGRDKPAKVLRHLVDIFKEGCVMGLNGKWGSGKTTFLNMWEQYMDNLGYKIIHFNSWENDDIDDPLIAFIAEFQKLTGKENPKWDNFVRTIGKISLAMLPSLLGITTELATGIPISKAIEKGGEEGANIMNNAVERYLEQKKSIAEFKKELNSFVNKNSNGKPIVFVIDELDRCNPQFAVKTLERIKHLFEVENIVYILAIDAEQLAHSIKGYFGSEGFDAKDYMRRFIRISYDLPTNGTKNIINSLFDNLGFKDLNAKCKKEYKSQYENLPNFIDVLYHDRYMSIRQLEQYMLSLRIALDNMIDLELSPSTIVMLTLLKMLDLTFFDDYQFYRLNDDDFIKYIEGHFGIELLDGTTPISLFNFLQSIADLMLIRYKPDDRESSLINKDGSLKFKTSLLNSEKFASCFSKPVSMMPGLDIVRDRINILGSVNYNFT